MFGYLAMLAVLGYVGYKYTYAAKEDAKDANAKVDADKKDVPPIEVKIDYRPVHTYTLSNDVEYIAPKARTY